MDGKYAVFVAEGNYLHIAYGTISDRIFERLTDYPVQIDGNTALAKFYASGLDDQHNVELAPMPGSTYTRASFARCRGLGVEVVVGRYW